MHEEEIVGVVSWWRVLYMIRIAIQSCLPTLEDCDVCLTSSNGKVLTILLIFHLSYTFCMVLLLSFIILKYINDFCFGRIKKKTSMLPSTFTPTML